MPTARITDFFRKCLDVDQPVTLAKKRPSATIEEKPVVKRQAYLDFGQKGLGQQTCKECGMCFDPAFKEDVKKHKQFHQKHVEALRKIKFTLPEDCPWEEVVEGHGEVFRLEAGKCRSVVEEVNERMEAATISCLDGLKIYMLLDLESCVRAACIVESITCAYKANKKDGTIELSKETVPAAIGISRIWVSPEHRRRGLAARLLECVRLKHLQPLKAAKQMIAFSQPTAEGYSLASRFQSGIFSDAACLLYKTIS